MAICRNWFVYLSLILLLEFILAIKCDQDERKCVIIGNKTICYFLPQTSEKMTWDESYAICRQNYSASLPSVPNKVIREALENYISDQKINFPFWTAGRLVKSSKWKWLNGQTYDGPEIKKRFESRIQGVLNKLLLYWEKSPFERTNYVCQHFGVHCKASGAIVLSDGCLMLYSSTALLNLSDARNACLERGGDLPVITNSDNLKKLNDIFSQLGTNAEIWMGLRRQWWIWKEIDVGIEVKYSNWDHNEGGNVEKECMIVDETSKWKQEYCEDRQRVICQTVLDFQEMSHRFETRNNFAIVTGIVIALMILVAAIVVAFLIIKWPMKVPFLLVRKEDRKLEHSSDFQECTTNPSAGRSVDKTKEQGHIFDKNKNHKNDHYCALVKNDNSKANMTENAISLPYEKLTIACAKDSDEVVQDHYAKIEQSKGSDASDEDDEEPKKTIVYAQLEFENQMPAKEQAVNNASKEQLELEKQTKSEFIVEPDLNIDKDSEKMHAVESANESVSLFTDASDACVDSSSQNQCISSQSSDKPIQCLTPDNAVQTIENL